jgi:hypothetical protein
MQVGVQPWIKTAQNDKVMNDASLTCSKPFYIKPFLTPINKIYIKIKDTFKSVLLYNTK